MKKTKMKTPNKKGFLSFSTKDFLFFILCSSAFDLSATLTPAYLNEAQKILEKNRAVSALVSSSTNFTSTCLPEEVAARSSLVHAGWNQRILVTPDQKTLVTPASNFLLTPHGQPRPAMQRLVDFVLTRSPEEQIKLNAALTTEHARNGNTFKVKDPDTGLYNKTVNVEVNGIAVPVSSELFDKFVQSTGPVLRAQRDLLQNIYTSEILRELLQSEEFIKMIQQGDNKFENLPQELQRLLVKSLKLEELPKEAQTSLMDAILSNYYMLPTLISPQLKDYPFLAVTGADANINPDTPEETVFFELNEGTPSGLSNGVQMLDDLRKVDPEQTQTFLPYLRRNNTFKVLKETIDKNAAAWTKRKDGISVMVGPGEFNGAHPDVSMISLLSGMPLVRKDDLYLDQNGDVRLNTGRKNQDPVVTGIYSRAEESFLLQSKKKGIIFKAPSRRDNFKEGKKFGLDLMPGDWYGEILGKNEQDEWEAVAIEVDEKGKPTLGFSEGMGVDPAHPENGKGNLAQAVLDRKIYLSNLGGRVVDDKKIFEVVSEYMAVKDQFRQGAKEIARPPKTLKPHEYHQFFGASIEELKRYVVKMTDSSGGDGVYLLINEDPKKKREVVELVRKNPENFIIQEMVDTPVMSVATKDAKGNPTRTSQVNDWRIFVMMDDRGNVRSDDQSILIRTAPLTKSKTNTSGGGGYGIGVVMDAQQAQREPNRSLSEPLLPEIPRHTHLTESKARDLKTFLYALNDLTAQFDGALLDLEKDQLNLVNFATKAKHLMNILVSHQEKLREILGRKYIPFLNFMRESRDQKGPWDLTIFKNLHLELYKMRNNLYQDHQFPIIGLEKLVHSSLNLANPTLVINPKEKRMAEDREIWAQLKINDQGVYTHIDNDFGKKVIEEIQKEGGNVILTAYESDAADFYVDPFTGKPSIRIFYKQPNFLTGLAHEYQHFKDWQMTKNELLRRGAEPKNAQIQARQIMLAKRGKYEKRAFQAELESDFGPTILNRSDFKIPETHREINLIPRKNYPSITTLADTLKRYYQENSPEDYEKALKVMKKMLLRSLEIRQDSFQSYQENWEQLPSEEKNSLKGEKLKSSAHFAYHLDIKNHLFQYDRGQFKGVEGLLDKVFQEAKRSILTDSEFRNFKLDEADPIYQEKFGFVDQLLSSHPKIKSKL